MEKYSMESVHPNMALWDLTETKRKALIALLSTVICSFAVHGFLFTNEFFSHDSISYFTYATGSFSFYTGIGRFVIPIYEMLKGDVAAPWLIGILYILWMSLSSLLIVQLLKIRSTLGVVLISALLCSNTALTLTGATYIYCMDEYAFALFTAVAAVWFFTKGRWWIFPGVAVLIISLAVYQAYFTVAACFCFLVILQRLANGENCGKAFISGVQYLALLAVSFLGYFGTWTAICSVTGVAKRRVEESLLGGGIQEILTLLKNANLQYVQALFDGSGVLGWLMPMVHAVLLVLLVWRLVQLLLTKELAAPNKILLVLLVCLMPTAFNSASILLAGSATQLMTFAWELPYVLLVLCLESGEKRNWKPAVRTAALVLLCCVLWQHTVYANQVYMKKELDHTATVTVAARIIDRIELTEGYVPGETPVAFVGRLDRNTYLNHGRDEFLELDKTVGLWSDYSATYNLGRYLTDYLNYPLEWDTVTDFSQHEEVRSMPAFPAVDGIRMIDGTVVIKLS